ncbi:DNA-3-methyladenine glycosylase I [Phaeovibrio sulfidiphilus]|uniref:DNA-3-methyladenine glycosylase I n=1 Tax=Phaeovibrio sulfidiphilus TaxID=1220600 RepID=A0A8J6YLC1_9PROT|nr:DNA-3-methyladenine glycosylase I [Phaeovibrio sulfidiphilus]MBE1236688.1 DNA-3-methyladenine glycosylase I [Phaeovibrio sulfidiphilus]
MSSYCDIAPGHPLHGPYHDTEYGFPSTDETVLFERLCLEIFQAGLSWELVLRRREALNRAFCGFDVDTLVLWGEEDVERLMQDPSIIRNRLKIRAVLKNAATVHSFRARYGGFFLWLQKKNPKTLEEWVKLFKSEFFFTGPEIVSEFLMSLSLLPGAHREDCPVHHQIRSLSCPWTNDGTETAG